MAKLGTLGATLRSVKVCGLDAVNTSFYLQERGSYCRPIYSVCSEVKLLGRSGAYQMVNGQALVT